MRRKRKETDGRPSIIFDVKKRQQHLTGFRKRKKERRKVAQTEILEAARKEKIDLKWEHREEVKRQWKEVQWAERKVEKLFGLEDDPKKRRKVALEDQHGGAIMDQNGQARHCEADRDGPVTVNFDLEDGDDDPFGGCEVTTTIGAVSSDALTTTKGGADGNSESTVAMFGISRRAALEQRLAMLRKLQYGYETDAQRNARRIESLRVQENIRLKALAKRTTKTLEENKKMKKKKKVKRKEKGAKSGAKERRRRKMK